MQEPTIPHLRPKRPLQRQVRLAPDAIAELIEGYQEGMTIQTLTKRFLISRTTVMAHLRRAGIKTRYNKMEGKLGEAKQLRTEGWSYARLGEHFGVTAHTVRRALGIEHRK